MTKRAILVVDLQNEYWPTGNFPLVGIEAAAANAARVIRHARDTGDLVVNIRHEMPGGPIFVPGSTGAQINEAVRPTENEPLITTNFANSFRETGLDDLLKRNRIEEVAVVGAMSHMCVDATTPAAQVHAAFMAALAFLYGEVVSTDEFLAR